MELWFFLIAMVVAAFFWIKRKREQDRRRVEEDRRRVEEDRRRLEEDRRLREEEEAKNLRTYVINKARNDAEALVKRGAIFEITTTSGIRGYHMKELGWVRCECDERSTAEKRLREMAADKFKSANTLTKLSHNLRDERYQAGTGPKGNPYYRNRKVKTWEAMACEAIPERQVDKSPILWNHQLAVLDGSNIAHWGDNNRASLDTVKAIVKLLKKEGAQVFLVFDSNIGFKTEDRHVGSEELTQVFDDEVDVEVVQSGTVADRRIVELAEYHKAIIVSNDLFRDSLRARFIPKRRGFFVPEYNYAELLPPRG